MGNYVEAVFLREEKLRFLCTVFLDGKEELCYVPSSCKLGSLIKLDGERVLLKPVESKSSKLRYALYAVMKQQGWILLNLAEVNKLIKHQRAFGSREHQSVPMFKQCLIVFVSKKFFDAINLAVMLATKHS